MNAQNQLLPVQFAGATLYIINQNDQPFVPMRPVVEGMGLDWGSQFSKIKQRFVSSVAEITTEGGHGKKRDFICLPLAKLAGWLYSISPNKVKPELRDKVIQYQAECDQVLFDYWTKGLAVRPSVTGDGVGDFQPRLDPWFMVISDWLDAPEQQTVNVFLTSEILHRALRYKPDHVAHHWQMVRIGMIMHKLGFIKRRESTGPHRRWYYQRATSTDGEVWDDVILPHEQPLFIQVPAQSGRYVVHVDRQRRISVEDIGNDNLVPAEYVRQLRIDFRKMQTALTDLAERSLVLEGERHPSLLAQPFDIQLTPRRVKY